MRRKFIAGNWKMNTNLEETRDLLQSLLRQNAGINKTDVMVAPPFVNLRAARDLLKDSSFKLGAQNLYWEEKGAFTGEVSALMLKDCGCEYVIIGHSERRQYFKETDQDVNRKVNASVKHQLKPVVCVGEILEEREQGKTLGIIEHQVRNGLEAFSKDQVQTLLIAYEPVWAIGTGRAATVQDAIEVHQLIRQVISEMFGKEISQNLRILYGGSVTAENIDGFIREAEIDGALVGGASLKSDAFSRIIQSAENSQT
jgi:triosephosphate isomerase